MIFRWQHNMIEWRDNSDLVRKMDARSRYGWHLVATIGQHAILRRRVWFWQ